MAFFGTKGCLEGGSTFGRLESAFRNWRVGFSLVWGLQSSLDSIEEGKVHHSVARIPSLFTSLHLCDLLVDFLLRLALNIIRELILILILTLTLTLDGVTQDRVHSRD